MCAPSHLAIKNTGENPDPGVCSISCPLGSQDEGLEEEDNGRAMQSLTMHPSRDGSPFVETESLATIEHK